MPIILINNPRDYQNLKLERARISTRTPGSEDPEDIVNRNYIDINDTFDTALSLLPVPISLGGITAGEIHSNKKMKEMFDELLYPLVAPEYTLPTMTLTTPDFNGAILEVGYQGDSEIVANVTLNDSVGGTGATPYEFTGNGIISSVVQASNSFMLFNYTTEETNDWQVEFDYDGAAIENDSHGNPDATGQFGAGSLIANLSVPGIWPYFWETVDGFQSAPLNSSDVRNELTKVLEVLPSEFTINVTLPAGVNKQKTVMFAIPDTDSEVVVLKNGDQVITGSFDITTVTVNDLNTTGQTKDYRVYHHDTGLGYEDDAFYTVKIYPAI